MLQLCRCCAGRRPSIWFTFFCILRVKFSTDLSPEGRHRRLSGRRTRCRSKVIVDNFPHGLGWVQKTEKEEVKQQPESSVLLLIGVLGFWVRCTAQSSWARYLPTYPAWNIEWRALKMEKKICGSWSGLVWSGNAQEPISKAKLRARSGYLSAVHLTTVLQYFIGVVKLLSMMERCSKKLYHTATEGRRLVCSRELNLTKTI